ncbi:MAG TPA: cyclase family protein [Pyrinomonadaceae bacterium]|nr:cyclase family protein [Pyrinomonadaceae bacterium]
MNTEQFQLVRVDLSPADYVHVPQAPRIERRPIFSRGGDNEWAMSGVVGLDAAGECVGVSNHTWSHLDAPYHLLPDGLSLDEIDPRQYLASRTRVVDLTDSNISERRETIDGVDYHNRIDVSDLPDGLAGYDALLFVTGFGALIDRGYPMRDGADHHYPNVTKAAAERIAEVSSIRLVGIDSPSFDKPETNAAAHRVLLGRRPAPVLLLETLTCERLRRALNPLPTEILLTVEPLRAYGERPDGALSSVYAYAATGAEGAAQFDSYMSLMRGAKVFQDGARDGERA